MVDINKMKSFNDLEEEIIEFIPGLRKEFNYNLQLLSNSEKEKLDLKFRVHYLSKCLTLLCDIRYALWLHRTKINKEQNMNDVIVSINNGVLSSVVINDPNIIVEVREYDDYSNHTDINVDEYGNEYGYELISSNDEEEQ